MILSMKPPYEITQEILRLISSISSKIGAINATFLDRQNPQLRRQNRIKTIHSSLQIEGNTLSENQITAIVENKRVVGPEKDILEVKNAIEIYENLPKLNAYKEKDFLKAHQVLMKNLITESGKYRQQNVGIVKGKDIQHIAPPFENIPFLMKDLFAYLQKEEDIILIKSCVFHYEMEFIHPFSDGNGRMGRLWQTLILMKEFPFFEFLPFETLISENQKEYYQSLSASDKQGKSTIFIEFMLQIIDDSLAKLTKQKQNILTDVERIHYFLTKNTKDFARKDYMEIFKDISSATASRDLKKGIEMGLFQKQGDKKTTIYSIKK